ncbi:MAG: hypothetical protein FJW21_09060 [Acidimicrobiia bacterium]|nr:hypothetical protein [Acidimicrobiia bacterium]
MTASWILVCVLMAATQVPATLDRILVVVNGDMITLSDVRAVRVLKLLPADAGDDEVVQALIDRRLVLAEMRRFQVPDPAPEAVAARRSQWMAAHLGEDPARLFMMAGVRADFVDRWIADEFRREVYLQQRFAALDADRREAAIRLWIESLRLRAVIVPRRQEFPATTPAPAAGPSRR